MANYSKWDKFSAALDDDGDDVEAGQATGGFTQTKMGSGVRVTRLDNAATVTIGGNDGIAIHAGTGGKPAAAAAKPKALPAPEQVKMGGALNYSKWDKIGDDLSESENEEFSEDEEYEEDRIYKEQEAKRRAEVEAKAEKDKEKDKARAVPTATSGGAAAGAGGGGVAGQGGAAGKAGKAGGGEEAKLRENGGEAEGHVWSQDQKEVVVSVFAPPGTRAKDLVVSLVPSPDAGKGKPSAQNQAAPPRLSVSLQGKSLVDKELAYPVQTGEDALDWQVMDSPAARKEPSSAPSRLVRITMRKKVPGDSDLSTLPREAGLILWWKRVFSGDEAIDVAAIPARQAKHMNNNQAIWQEAHAQFREMVEKREPMEIDVGPPE